jgi:secreted trypsin-like serine protease
MKKSTQVLTCLLLIAAFIFRPDFSQAQQKHIFVSSFHELIIGGKNVRKDDGLAAVTVALMNVQSGALCTATLLSQSIALTAAHCVDGRAEDMRLLFGTKLKGDVRRVLNFATPSSWLHQEGLEKDTGDLALLNFEGGLPLTAGVADLMSSNEHLSDGDVVTLAGFGISKAANQTGHGILRSVEVRIKDSHYSSTEILLDQTDRKGACHGDSGGPAFIQDSNGELKLWGVTSRGVEDPADLCIGLSVYTRIEAYLDWINRTIESWRALE